MGNYTNLETEFIQGTIRLIDQYDELIANLNFEKQLNYTLTINCLLGLIVMLKERVIFFISNDVITDAYKKNLGFEHSILGGCIIRFRDSILQLRNSVDHFKIEVESENEELAAHHSESHTSKVKIMEV
jgi:hypothetical protein